MLAVAAKETVSTVSGLASPSPDHYLFRMSLHSYSRVWVHLIWATLERRPLLSRSAAVKMSGFLSDYASEKGIYMKINYVNPEHVHALVDLPTNLCLEEAMQLFKGGSSHWINESNLVPGKFGWGGAAMAPSRFLIPGLAKWPSTSPIRRSTIARKVFLRSSNCSSSDTS